MGPNIVRCTSPTFCAIVLPEQPATSVRADNPDTGETKGRFKLSFEAPWLTRAPTAFAIVSDWRKGKHYGDCDDSYSSQIERAFRFTSWNWRP